MLKCIVVPSKGKEVIGIFSGNKRISERTELCLNKKEIIKCMKTASVYGVRNDGSTILFSNSDEIDREIMAKVNERKKENSLLDYVGITNNQKDNIKSDINKYPQQNNVSGRRKPNKK